MSIAQITPYVSECDPAETEYKHLLCHVIASKAYQLNENDQLKYADIEQACGKLIEERQKFLSLKIDKVEATDPQWYTYPLLLRGLCLRQNTPGLPLPLRCDSASETVKEALCRESSTVFNWVLHICASRESNVPVVVNSDLRSEFAHTMYRLSCSMQALGNAFVGTTWSKKDFYTIEKAAMCFSIARSALDEIEMHASDRLCIVGFPDSSVQTCISLVEMRRAMILFQFYAMKNTVEHREDDVWYANARTADHAYRKDAERITVSYATNRVHGVIEKTLCVTRSIFYDTMARLASCVLSNFEKSDVLYDTDRVRVQNRDEMLSENRRSRIVSVYNALKLYSIALGILYENEIVVTGTMSFFSVPGTVSETISSGVYKRTDAAAKADAFSTAAARLIEANEYITECRAAVSTRSFAGDEPHGDFIEECRREMAISIGMYIKFIQIAYSKAFTDFAENIFDHSYATRDADPVVPFVMLVKNATRCMAIEENASKCLDSKDPAPYAKKQPVVQAARFVKSEENGNGAEWIMAETANAIIIEAEKTMRKRNSELADKKSRVLASRKIDAALMAARSALEHHNAIHFQTLHLLDHCSSTTR